MELVTPRLLLRELDPADWREIHEYESDPEVVRYESFGPTTIDETIAYLERAIDDAADTPRLTWDLAVVLRRTGRLIGRCGVQLTKPEQHEATLWYILRRSAWGHGYATEAARKMAELAFTEARAHRLIAEADPRNSASIRVLEKVGMRREGLSRESHRLADVWCDLAHYAILDHEWARQVLEATVSGGAGAERRDRGARRGRT